VVIYRFLGTAYQSFRQVSRSTLSWMVLLVILGRLHGGTSIHIKAESGESILSRDYNLEYQRTGV
jgi:hypothetical protein